MKIQIKPGFLFPTQFWTAELNENIEQLQKEAYLIRENDKDGVIKSNSGFQGYHSKDSNNYYIFFLKTVSDNVRLI